MESMLRSNILLTSIEVMCSIWNQNLLVQVLPSMTQWFSGNYDHTISYDNKIQLTIFSCNYTLFRLQTI
jgi:hypothetical protein